MRSERRGIFWPAIAPSTRSASGHMSHPCEVKSSTRTILGGSGFEGTWPKADGSVVRPKHTVIIQALMSFLAPRGFESSIPMQPTGLRANRRALREDASWGNSIRSLSLSRQGRSVPSLASCATGRGSPRGSPGSTSRWPTHGRSSRVSPPGSGGRSLEDRQVPRLRQGR